MNCLNSPRNMIHFFNYAEKLMATDQPARLVITKNKFLDYHFEIRLLSIRERAFNFFCCSTRDHESIENLKEILGERRLKRIFFRGEYDLDPQKLQNTNFNLHKAIVQKIIIGLADIRLTDLEDKAKQNKRTLSSLSASEMDSTYYELFPISNFLDYLKRNFAISHRNLQVKLAEEEVVVEAMRLEEDDEDKKEKVIDEDKLSESYFNKLIGRVWVIHHAKKRLHHNVDTVPAHKKALESRLLHALFSKTNPVEGSLLCLSDGYYSVDRVFSDEDIDVTVLTKIVSEGEKPSVLLFCRGEIIQYRQGGFSGIQSCLDLSSTNFWNELESFLVEKHVRWVTIYGDSFTKLTKIDRQSFRSLLQKSQQIFSRHVA